MSLRLARSISYTLQYSIIISTGEKINHPTYIQFFFHFSNSEVPCWKRSDSEKLTIETFARSNEAVVDFLRKKLSWEEDQLIIRLSPAG
jgi:hypothetical protein